MPRTTKSLTRRSQLKRSGIVDWNAKGAVLRSLYGVTTSKALFTEVLSKYYPDDELLEVAKKLADAARKWTESTPQGDVAMEFWEWVLQGRNIDAGFETIRTMSVEDFIDLLPEASQKRRVVLDLVNGQNEFLQDADAAKLKVRFCSVYATMDSEGDTDLERDDEVHITANINAKQESLVTGRRNGQVGVHQAYNSPEAAKAWTNLIDSKNYEMYLQCLISLRKLSNSDTLKNAVRESDFNIAVALGGGGSPEKDLLVADSLSKIGGQIQKQFEYLILDISYFMILETRVHLKRQQKLGKLNASVNFKSHVNDFMELDTEFRRQQHWHSVVWTILGGTIGNVKEKSFFRSLNGPAKQGDLLIIGIDTWDGEHPAKFEERMISQYETKEMDQCFLDPMFPDLLIGKTEPVISVEVPKKTTQFSDVPNSRDVILRVENLVIVSSTRYLLTDFVDFARKLGWEQIEVAQASAASTFRQLLLRRM